MQRCQHRRLLYQVKLPLTLPPPQVMEQLFQAYQQRLEPAAARQWQAERWVDQSKLQYDCPGEQLLNVSFHALPDADVNVPFWLLNTMPTFAVFGAALSFIFVCLYLAIFKCAPLPVQLSEILCYHDLCDPSRAIEAASSSDRSCRKAERADWNRAKQQRSIQNLNARSSSLP